MNIHCCKKKKKKGIHLRRIKLWKQQYRDISLYCWQFKVQNIGIELFPAYFLEGKVLFYTKNYTISLIKLSFQIPERCYRDQNPDLIAVSNRT